MNKEDLANRLHDLPPGDLTLTGVEGIAGDIFVRSAVLVREADFASEQRANLIARIGVFEGAWRAFLHADHGPHAESADIEAPGMHRPALGVIDERQVFHWRPRLEPAFIF